MLLQNKIKALTLSLAVIATAGLSSFALAKSNLVDRVAKQMRGKAIKVAIADEDSDRDGLNNAEEYDLGLNPYDNDSDGDGYSDPREMEAGFNPAEVETQDLLDQDADGLTGEDEKRYGTNPLLNDTDFDGFADGVEIATGNDPLTTDLSFLRALLPENNASAADANSQEVAAAAKNVALDANTIDLMEKSFSSSDPQLFQANLASLLTNISDQTEPEEIKTTSLPKLSRDQLSLSSDTSPDAVKAYVNHVSIILYTNLPFTDMSSFEQFALSVRVQNSQDMKKIIEILDKVYIELKQVSVPDDPEIVDLHLEALRALAEARAAASQFEAMNYENLTNPYPLISNIEEVNKLVQERILGDILPRVKALSEKYGFTLPSEIDLGLSL